MLLHCSRSNRGDPTYCKMTQFLTNIRLCGLDQTRNLITSHSELKNFPSKPLATEPYVLNNWMAGNTISKFTLCYWFKYI